MTQPIGPSTVSPMSLRQPIRKHFDTIWGPPQFTNWVDESMSWKETCYIGDWSYLDEFHIKGPDALRFLSEHMVNSVEKFALGQAKHGVFCNKAGKVIGEGVLSRLGDNASAFARQRVAAARTARAFEDAVAHQRLQDRLEMAWRQAVTRVD